MNVKSEQYADIIETARKLIEAADGLTVDRYGCSPLPLGYAVGGACRGFNVAEHRAVYDSALTERVAAWIQAQPSNVEWFGSWRDGGRVYFDGVDILGDYAAALSLAFVRQEQAIYDLGAGVCIDVQTAVREVV